MEPLRKHPENTMEAFGNIPDGHSQNFFFHREQHGLPF